MAENYIDLKFIADTAPLERAEKVADRLEKRINKLVSEEAKGRITTQQYSAEVRKMASEMQKAAGGTIQARNAVNSYSRAVYQAAEEARQFAAAAQASQKAIHRQGVVMQQVGYQAGDFIVQVQSGTNAFVAFGQQATQLVGVMGMLNPKLIGIGAALGIIIPLATAFGAAWLRSRQEAEKAAGSVETLDDKLKKLNTTLETWNKTKRAASLGVTLDELIGVESVAEAEAKVAAARKLVEQFNNMVTSPGLGAGLGAGGGLGLLELFGLGPESKLEDAKAKLAEAERALADIQAKVRQEAREKAEAELNASWEEQKRAQALAEYEAGQAAIAERKAWVEEATQIFRDAQKRMRDEEIARTEKQLEVLFRSRTLYYSIRFRGEEEVMSQGLTPSGKMKPSQSYEELIAMGWSPEDLKRIGLTAPKTGGGGRKSPAEQLEEYMKKQENLVELQTRQIGLSEEQARIEELKNKYVLAGIEPNMQRIQALAAEEEQLRKTTEAEQKRKSMMETIEGHIENAFMSMIDGSSSVEDAFKGMLRNILLEIYRQQIAKPMASGIMKLFGFADGGAFSSGRVIPFANGGVVTGPTTFPMPGATGLMGEAGPEAIMPLKRGPNGKLGVEASGGQQVVVNQSFNFAANGDESVKKIIAQAAPQIAQMTQKQIMDSRRRGGQMKAAFS